MDYNDLLEEEIEIIEVFNYELKEFGHYGYCSFYEKIPNGYYIYKDDDKWICQFNEKGKVSREKKYTNVYNLCFDILEELKINPFYFNIRNLKMPNGTKVIITKDKDYLIDEITLGVIVGSSVLSNSSFEEKRLYQVLSDDGKIYEGLYGFKIYGDICFRTMEDYIKDTKKEIAENRETIQELHETNWDLYLSLNDVLNIKEKYLSRDNKKKK